MRIVIATTLLLLVTTCGQKGPLYLPKPEQPKPAQSQPPQTNPEPSP